LEILTNHSGSAGRNAKEWDLLPNPRTTMSSRFTPLLAPVAVATALLAASPAQAQGFNTVAPTPALEPLLEKRPPRAAVVK